MEKFDSFKKTVDNSKSFIKKAIVAGSILLSAEQGLAQVEPSQKDKYIPDKNWSFDKEWMYDNKDVKNFEAVKESVLHPGYFEDYTIDNDSTYFFNGYVNDNGEKIRTIQEIDNDIAKEEEDIKYHSNKENIKKKLDYELTTEYKEKAYNNLIKNTKEHVDELKSVIELKNMVLKYHKEWKRTPEQEKEAEDEFNLFNNSLTYFLNNKEKTMNDPVIAPIHTYEEMSSMFEGSKEIAEFKLEKLLKEKEEIEKYLSKLKEDK